MKIQILTIILTLMFFKALGQVKQDSEFMNDDGFQQMETFKNSNKGTHGIYLGLGGGYANFGSRNFSTFNSRLAYVIDQKFEIGFAGQSFQSLSAGGINEGIREVVAGGVGGLHLKAIFFGKKKIHFSTPLFLGVGGVGVASYYFNNWFEDFNSDLESSSIIFVAEPGVNIEFNISKVLGFEMGAKYRLAHQAQLVSDDYFEMNGMMLNATLKIGFFDFGGRNKKSKKQKCRIFKKEVKEEIEGEFGYNNY